MKKMVTENEYRELKNEVVLQRDILESIRDLLDGKEVSDFMMSFGIVRRVCDLIDGQREANMENTEVLQILDELDELVAWGKMVGVAHISSDDWKLGIMVRKIEGVVQKHTPKDKVGD